MLSKHDKEILNNLKDIYPEAYELFIRREKEQFANVKKGCHDLLNYVTLISGSYQLMSLTNPALSSSSRWKTMGEDINNLIKAFKDIGEYRYADHLHIQPENINSLIEILTDYARSTHKNVDVLNCMDELILNTDLQKLSAAIKHLMDNAIEAGDCTKVIISEVNNELTINVSNNGTPIPPDIVDNMYKPFESTKSGHLGLGLSIARKTIEALGGHLDLSQYDNKICFTIFCPL